MIDRETTQENTNTLRTRKKNQVIYMKTRKMTINAKAFRLHKKLIKNILKINKNSRHEEVIIEKTKSKSREHVLNLRGAQINSYEPSKILLLLNLKRKKNTLIPIHHALRKNRRHTQTQARSLLVESRFACPQPRQ